MRRSFLYLGIALMLPFLFAATATAKPENVKVVDTFQNERANLRILNYSEGGLQYAAIFVKSGPAPLYVALTGNSWKRLLKNLNAAIDVANRHVQGASRDTEWTALYKMKESSKIKESERATLIVAIQGYGKRTMLGFLIEQPGKKAAAYAIPHDQTNRVIDALNRAGHGL